MRTIKDIPDLAGKRVFLRLDLNVPVDGGEVRDDFRIKTALPALEFLRTSGAKILIGSHFEGPVGAYESIVAPYMAEVCGAIFLGGKTKNIKEILSSQKPGEVILLENLRLHPGEKANDDATTKSFASLADIYVNEAFSVCHRAHASVVGIPKHIPGYAGLRLEEEVRELSSAFNPPHPFLFILGGAKFDTKMPLIEKLLPLADTVFIGGALANDFFKEQGLNIGRSVVSDGDFGIAKLMKDKKIILPVDVTVENEEKNIRITSPRDLRPGEAIWDAGPETLRSLSDTISKAKYILWNGPLGYYEAGFTKYTEELAREIAASGARSIVGGGDTLAAISKFGLEDKFSFISTGGGAMLDFLATGTLPGIEALE